MSSEELEIDWTETQKWVGRNLMVKPVSGVDAVEMGSIRRQLEALEFDCPLHYDDAVAKKYGYKGVIAPMHMSGVFGRQAYWEPGDSTRWPSDESNYRLVEPPKGENLRPPTPGKNTVVTDTGVEFVKPLYVGDQVMQVESKLVDVNPRETRVGKGAFLSYESRQVNQRGETVAIGRSTNFNYNPRPRTGS